MLGKLMKYEWRGLRLPLLIMLGILGGTTLLACIIIFTINPKMDDVTAGDVNFCGKNIAGMGERELADLRLDEMGFIFQQMYML